MLSGTVTHYVLLVILAHVAWHDSYTPFSFLRDEFLHCAAFF